ncbi:hypothetical protein [Lentilitoribacter sp. EG35]|jgi:hypothetical protein|uniref:hypothetical protein n=1 Tax=Lentilitoribacter sp. EG35 TaxID=3234192 RepID=UPI003460CFE9
MAEKKSKRLLRLVEIQRQKEKIVENDLALVLAEQRYTEDGVTSIIGALGDFTPVNMVMAGHYAKRLSSLETKKEKLNKHRGLLEKNKLTESVKADRISEKVIVAQSDEAREQEEEDLQDLIDGLSAREKSSLW